MTGFEGERVVVSDWRRRVGGVTSRWRPDPGGLVRGPVSPLRGPRPGRRAARVVAGRRSRVAGQGVSREPWEPSVLASVVAARQAVCDGGSGSRGIDWRRPDRAIVRGGCAAASRQAAAKPCCRPRVHTSQSLTTHHQEPPHDNDAPTRDLPTTQAPPTRPTFNTHLQRAPTPKPSSPQPKPMTNARTRGRHTCRFRTRNPTGVIPGVIRARPRGRPPRSSIVDDPIHAALAIISRLSRSSSLLHDSTHHESGQHGLS